MSHWREVICQIEADRLLNMKIRMQNEERDRKKIADQKSTSTIEKKNESP